MDNTMRQEEKDICERWAADFGFEVEYFPLEKGLERLTSNGRQRIIGSMDEKMDNSIYDQSLPMFEFSLPEDNQG